LSLDSVGTHEESHNVVACQAVLSDATGKRRLGSSQDPTEVEDDTLNRTTHLGPPHGLTLYPARQTARRRTSALEPIATTLYYLPNAIRDRIVEVCLIDDGSTLGRLS